VKILLTCTSIEDDHRVEDNHDSHYPLGLAYIQSYIEHRRPGQDQFINVYLNNIPTVKCNSIIKNHFKKFKPEVFGVSMMTHSRVSAYRVIEYVHKHYPDTHIVVGGIHATIMWQQIVKKYPYVVIVRGEGEVTFHELIEAFESKKLIDDIAGIVHCNNGKIVATESRELINDLDDLPFPKHELFVNQEKRMANLLTSRGCPYRCNFCVLDWMSKRKVRFRSGENIADEVEMILEKFPSITTIWIHDDAFMINQRRTIEFCDAIIKRGIKTQFIASARFRPISYEVVDKMEQAGFVQVLFGLETAAESVMKGMRKGITKDDVRYGLELFGRTGMKATAFLIAGLPGETDETIKETIRFIQEIQNINYLFYDDIGVAMMYPGTELYASAKETGKINDDYWLTDANVPFYTIEHGGVHTYKKLLEMKEEIRKSISLEYIFTPNGFLRQEKLIPAILKYSQQFNMGGINNILNEALQRDHLLLPIIHSFFMGSSEQLNQMVVRSFEKSVIQIIFNRHLHTQVRRQEFLQLHETQKKRNVKLFKLYEERKKTAIEKLSKKYDVGDVEYNKKPKISNTSKELDFNISTVGGI